jgi:hypothetical protein
LEEKLIEEMNNQKNIDLQKRLEYLEEKLIEEMNMKKNNYFLKK